MSDDLKNITLGLLGAIWAHAWVGHLVTTPQGLEGLLSNFAQNNLLIPWLLNFITSSDILLTLGTVFVNVGYLALAVGLIGSILYDRVLPYATFAAGSTNVFLFLAAQHTGPAVFSLNILMAGLSAALLYTDSN